MALQKVTDGEPDVSRTDALIASLPDADPSPGGEIRNLARTYGLHDRLAEFIVPRKFFVWPLWKKLLFIIPGGAILIALSLLLNAL